AGPGSQLIDGASGAPLMQAGTIVLERPTPMALGGVAGAGEAEKVAFAIALAQNGSQLGVHLAAAFAVAPTRHDQRAGNDLRTLLSCPPCGSQEPFRPVGVPVGEQQLGFGRDGVDDLGAEDAVFAVLGFQVVIGAKRADVDAARKRLAEVPAIAAKTRIEDGD